MESKISPSHPKISTLFLAVALGLLAGIGVFQLASKGYLLKQKFFPGKYSAEKTGAELSRISKGAKITKAEIEIAEEKLQSKRSEVMPIIDERKAKIENKLRSEEMLKRAVTLRQEAENEKASIEKIKTSLEHSRTQFSREMTNLLGKDVKIV